MLRIFLIFCFFSLCGAERQCVIRATVETEWLSCPRFSYKKGQKFAEISAIFNIKLELLKSNFDLVYSPPLFTLKSREEFAYHPVEYYRKDLRLPESFVTCPEIFAVSLSLKTTGVKMSAFKDNHQLVNGIFFNFSGEYSPLPPTEAIINSVECDVFSIPPKLTPRLRFSRFSESQGLDLRIELDSSPPYEDADPIYDDLKARGLIQKIAEAQYTQ